MSDFPAASRPFVFSVTLMIPTAAQAVLTSPNAITLTATATDTDPGVSNVSFYNGATLIGTVVTGQAAANGQPAQVSSSNKYEYVWTPTDRKSVV